MYPVSCIILENPKQLVVTMEPNPRSLKKSSSSSTVHGNKESIALAKVHATQLPAAGPTFTAVFKDWKESVPKLYKYPASQLEVIVHRRSGEVNKIRSAKPNKKASHAVKKVLF